MTHVEMHSNTKLGTDSLRRRLIPGINMLLASLSLFSFTLNLFHNMVFTP